MTRPFQQVADFAYLIQKKNYYLNFNLNIISNSHHLRPKTVFSPTGLCPTNIRSHYQPTILNSEYEYHFQNYHKMNKTFSVPLPAKAFHIGNLSQSGFCLSQLCKCQNVELISCRQSHACSCFRVNISHDPVQVKGEWTAQTFLVYLT